MQNESFSNDAAWFVIASLCDCGHVAATVMDAAIVADTTPSNSATEITATGIDWRALVTEAATTLASRTGRRIAGTCTAVYVRNPDERRALEKELADHVYRVADDYAAVVGQAIAVTHGSYGEDTDRRHLLPAES